MHGLHDQQQAQSYRRLIVAGASSRPHVPVTREDTYGCHEAFDTSTEGV